MTNRQIIKSAHIWALTLLLASGLWAIAGKAGINVQDQNSNQNSNGNSNRNSNSNTGDATRSQNDNRSGNRNTGGASGERAGMSSQDHKFVMDAAMGGMMEVELGRWAAQKGASDAVKQFGQRMVDDHSKANQELMTLAASKGMTLPTALDEKHQGHVTKISALTGAEFDRAYAKMMLSDHEKDVKAFERQSSKGADADLKAFATSTLPTLQEHLQMARALPGNEGSGGNRNNSGNSNNSGGSKNSNRNSNGNGNSNRP